MCPQAILQVAEGCSLPSKFPAECAHWHIQLMRDLLEASVAPNCCQQQLAHFPHDPDSKCQFCVESGAKRPPGVIGNFISKLGGYVEPPGLENHRGFFLVGDHTTTEELR